MLVLYLRLSSWYESFFFCGSSWRALTLSAPLWALWWSSQSRLIEPPADPHNQHEEVSSSTAGWCHSLSWRCCMCRDSLVYCISWVFRCLSSSFPLLIDISLSCLCLVRCFLVPPTPGWVKGFCFPAQHCGTSPFLAFCWAHSHSHWHDFSPKSFFACFSVSTFPVCLQLNYRTISSSYRTLWFHHHCQFY